MVKYIENKKMFFRKLKEEKNIHYKDVKEIEIISDDNIVWIDKIKTYIDDEIKAVKGGK